MTKISAVCTKSTEFFTTSLTYCVRCKCWSCKYTSWVFLYEIYQQSSFIYIRWQILLQISSAHIPSSVFSCGTSSFSLCVCVFLGVCRGDISFIMFHRLFDLFSFIFSAKKPDITESLYSPLAPFSSFELSCPASKCGRLDSCVGMRKRSRECIGVSSPTRRGKSAFTYFSQTLNPVDSAMIIAKVPQKKAVLQVY